MRAYTRPLCSEQTLVLRARLRADRQSRSLARFAQPSRAPMQMKRLVSTVVARRPLRSRALSSSSLHLLAKSYQLPTIVLGTTAEADVAALCERASASAFCRQGMPLVLVYAACDADAAHVQQHLASLRAQHLLPVGVTNVTASTASALASAGVPLLFSGGQGTARGAARGDRAAGPAAPTRRAAPPPPPPPPPRPAAEAAAPAAAPEFGAMQVRAHRMHVECV